MSELTAWILSTGSFAAIVLLTALAAKSFAGDAARGRRRCPRCWHELGPAPAAAAGLDAAQRARHCSECGFVATREEDTLRTRRRVGVGILAVAGVLAIVAAARIRFLDQGVWSMAPTRILILASPYFGNGGYQSVQSELATRIGTMRLDDSLLRDAVELVVAGDSIRVAGSQRWYDTYGPMVDALLRTIPRDDPLLERFLDIPPMFVVSFLGARDGRPNLLCVDVFDQWPAGVESRLDIEFADGSRRRARFHSSSRTNDLLVEVPPSLGAGDAIELVLSVRLIGAGDDAWRRYPSALARIPEFHGRSAREPDARPVDSPELRATVSRVFSPDNTLMVWTDGTPRAGLQFSSLYGPEGESGTTLFGVRAEICENGVVRRTSRIWWTGNAANPRFRWLAPIEDIEALARLAAQDPALDSNWTLRITGDADLADYARPPVAEHPVRDSFQYWSGTMEIPLKVERAGGPSPIRRWTLEP